ncbi:hypothetical protein IPJ70_01190 [Candidatus Campbellbacteria bacterium]|nr:MAG: hypothetical protein IPJ70_01190 [Candidatus Campbellbacteria bacterium]
MGKILRKEIREHLIKTLRLTKGSLAVRISEIKYAHPQLTPAAAAQYLARKKGKSLMRFLDDDDKKSLATVTTIPVVPVAARPSVRSGKRPLPPILVFPSTNSFILRHVEEINGTYHANCCTATFILCRKVMENLIVQILKKKFPSVKNKKLYEDNTSRRSLDFSIVLDNFFRSRTKFSISGSSAIERIKQKATPFKDDANDKTHSLFHIASKKEMEDANVQEIFDLITVVMKEVGL